GVDQFGVGFYGFCEFLRAVRMNESRINAQLLQIHAEQGVRAAVQRGGGHDVVARLAKGQYRGGLGGLAGGAGERRAAVLDRGHALFEHRHRRVRNPRVDIAERLQVKEARLVLGRIEHERSGLVDRRRARAGGRIRNLPRVQAKRLESELAVRHEAILPPCGGVQSAAGSSCGSALGFAAARRYSEGGMPTCCWKKRVKFDCAEKPSSADTSAILPRPDDSLEIAEATHSISR